MPGVSVDGNEIRLTGVVGGDSWYWEEGFSSGNVAAALAAIGRDKDVVVRLNSGGGIATEGAAIHAVLDSHKGKVTLVVEGIAASAASLIAMAGDEIVMAPGAVMMIHDPAAITFGDVVEHQRSIGMLNALGSAYAGVYAERSGKSEAAARDVMRAETWMSAAEAVEAGFADRVGSGDEREVSPYAYQLYARAPDQLVALAQARGWKARASMAAPTASSTRQQENPMPKKVPAQAEAAPENPETPPAAAPAAAPAPAPAEPAPAEPAAPPADPVAAAVARSAEISELCAAAGVPAMAAALIREGVSVVEAKARVDAAGEIRRLVANAAKVNPAIEAKKADDFIAQGFSVAKVRDALFDQILAKQSPEVSAHVAPDANQKHGAGWDRAFAAATGRKE